MAKCTIIRSGDIETNPWPLGENADEEAILQETVDSAAAHELKPAELGKIEELINVEGEAVNILLEQNEIVEVAREEDEPLEHLTTRHRLRQLRNERQQTVE